MQKTEFFLNIDNVNLRILKAEKAANKLTIVFLHESFGSIEHWKNFPFELSELTNCNIMIYDRQGYGKSDNFSTDKRKNDYL
jgi:pimeloyl-ACP methyl ester carboxylesterase